ncbi:unnamed protein product, partial [Pylaiella littoralis]
YVTHIGRDIIPAERPKGLDVATWVCVGYSVIFFNLQKHQCVRLSPDKDLSRYCSEHKERVQYVYHCFYAHQILYRCSSPEGIRLNKTIWWSFCVTHVYCCLFVDTTGLCRPANSFAAKDGGRRAATNGEELGRSHSERELFFRRLVPQVHSGILREQTRRTCLGRHHHQRRKDGMETPSSTTSDDAFVFLYFFFFCLLRFLPGLLVRCRQHSRQQLTAVVCSYLLTACSSSY